MKIKITLFLVSLLAMPVMADDIDEVVPGDTARVYDIDELSWYPNRKNILCCASSL